MKQYFFQFINRLATGRNVIIIILVWLSYAIFVMGLSQTSSPDSIVPIDITFAPSVTTICNMIEAYGEDVRRSYMRGEITWDAIYPLLYGLMLLLGLSYGMRVAGINFAHKDKLFLLPLVVMGADYCENVGIVTLLWMYPSCSLEVAAFVSIFVTLKWVTTVICFLMLIAIFFVSLFRKIRGHK
ncbi:MAG: hypothetical protein COA47_05700 [Robiginitomaculum sp.]|nr:MAG: hypothetical protein COA47_05700 [Robiginitomaculum sp.]